MEGNNVNELSGLVCKTSLYIHHYQRSGHLETLYENALAHRLRRMGLDMKQQYELPVKQIALSLCVSCASLWLKRQ